jgi:hypothetical protein
MDHMQFLMVRAHDAEETISGHALMATAPPDSHIANHPEEKYPHQMPDVAMPDLMKLLDLSARLPLDGEITPIMAWVMILKDQNFKTLTKEEIGAIKGELLAKVRCYGYVYLSFAQLASTDMSQLWRSPRGVRSARCADECLGRKRPADARRVATLQTYKIYLRYRLETHLGVISNIVRSYSAIQSYHNFTVPLMHGCGADKDH